MKKFLVLICTLCVCVIGLAFADTLNVTWYNEDYTTYDTTTCTIGGTLTLPTTPTKHGYTFLGWKKIYTPIEYIEATGTQYIDTGFKPNQNTRIIITFAVDGAGNNNTVFYFREVINSMTTDYGELLASTTWRSAYRSQTETNPGTNIANVKITLDKNKHITTLYDNLNNVIGTHSFASATFQFSGTLILCGTHSYNNVAGLHTNKIYSFKLYDDGTLIRDMIPVLDTDGVACMWDKVSKTFFYNAGTGDFIAGPEI